MMALPRSRHGLALVILPFLLLAAGTMYAEEKEPPKRFIYQWTDEAGSTHIVDSLEKVPKKYRPKASAMEQKVSSEGREEQLQQEPYQVPPDNGASREWEEQSRKAEWQGRMRDALARKGEAESRLQTFVRERTALQEKWGHGAQGYSPEAQDELERLDGEISRAEADRDEARNDIEVVIPDEARKAGIPPGWLREVQ